MDESETRPRKGNWSSCGCFPASRFNLHLQDLWPTRTPVDFPIYFYNLCHVLSCWKRVKPQNQSKSGQLHIIHLWHRGIFCISPEKWAVIRYFNYRTYWLAGFSLASFCPDENYNLQFYFPLNLQKTLFIFYLPNIMGLKNKINNKLILIRYNIVYL